MTKITTPPPPPPPPFFAHYKLRTLFWYRERHTGHTGLSSQVSSSKVAKQVWWNTWEQDNSTVILTPDLAPAPQVMLFTSPEQSDWGLNLFIKQSFSLLVEVLEGAWSGSFDRLVMAWWRSCVVYDTDGPSPIWSGNTNAPKQIGHSISCLITA